MDSEILYDKFRKVLLPTSYFKRHKYPVPDSSNPDLCAHEDSEGQEVPLDAQFASSYICKHCSKSYTVNSAGEQIDTSDPCFHHPGRWSEEKGVHSCCKKAGSGCCTNKYHVNEGETLLSTYQNYVTTQDKPELEPNRHGVFAIQTQFCYTTHGPELTRVVVLDHNGDELYNTFVKPAHPILHYGTKFTGLSETDFHGVTTSLADVQRDLLKTFSSKSILVGHDMGRHMKALKMFHRYFVDTCYLCPHPRKLPFKHGLALLVRVELYKKLKEAPRHPKDDAKVTLELAKYKFKRLAFNNYMHDVIMQGLPSQFSGADFE